MCLYSRLLENPRYKANSKNGGIIPPIRDIRTNYVPTGCGKCIECRKKKARDWQIRLLEDIKDNTNGIFITLTFSTASLIKLERDVNNWMIIDNKRVNIKRNLKGYDLDNEICKRAVRLFNERYRKKYKNGLRHWLVSELGHEGTEHVHLHGLIYTDVSPYEITDIWKYGFTWTGDDKYGKRVNYVDESTVNYITKYVSKVDFDHREYNPVILNSPGIGAGYIKRARDNNYHGADTLDFYRTSTGHKVQLPQYYRNKLYTDEERENLWLFKLDKNERYICGEKIRADDCINLMGLLRYHRKRNIELGYGDNTVNWDRVEYERIRRIIIQTTRMKMKEDKKPQDLEEAPF